MRVFGLGLLAALVLSFSPTADAGRIAEGPSTALEHTTTLSVDLGHDIALGALISPAMQWSQLEIDSVKAEGLNSSLPFAYTAELAMKSDFIKSYNVPQLEQTALPFGTGKYRSSVGLLMLLAGLTMWVGLSLQRKY